MFVIISYVLLFRQISSIFLSPIVGLSLMCSFWDLLASSTSGFESIDMTSLFCWLGVCRGLDWLCRGLVCLGLALFFTGLVWLGDLAWLSVVLIRYFI